MQVFLLLALVVALVAVLFALQNVVPVTVSFLAWTFEGSLALVLFVALVAGAVVSFLASVPALLGQRRSSGQAKKRIAELEASLGTCRGQLEQAERQLAAPPPPPSIGDAAPAGPAELDGPRPAPPRPFPDDYDRS